MRDPVVPDSDMDLPLLPRRACLKGLALGLAALPAGRFAGKALRCAAISGPRAAYGMNIPPLTCRVSPVM